VDKGSPNSMMAVAKEVASQLLGFDTDMRTTTLAKLREENAPLHALVKYQLSRLIKAASKTEKNTMAKEGPYKGLSGTLLLHFDYADKLYSLEVRGVEYRQHMSSGDIHIGRVEGAKEAVQTFIKLFSPKNRSHILVIVSSDGKKVIFQAPIAIASINSSTDAKAGILQLNKVLLKFTKEIITLDLNGQPIDEVDETEAE
jgi:hypothetical protein